MDYIIKLSNILANIVFSKIADNFISFISRCENYFSKFNDFFSLSVKIIDFDLYYLFFASKESKNEADFLDFNKSYYTFINDYLSYICYTYYGFKIFSL